MERVTLQTTAAGRLGLRDLLSLSVAGLEDMFVSSEHLFCHRRVRTLEGRILREGISPRYTAMTLLGLARYQNAGFECPFALHDLASKLMRRSDFPGNIGDLGLMLWMRAELGLQRSAARAQGMPDAHALENCFHARIGSTMELAWYLIGIGKCVLVDPSQRAVWEKVARECYGLLKRNQGSSGIFGHLAARSGPAGWLRGRIGSFADQVYPIYALTAFASAFGVPEAVRSAEACARAICRVQGPLGQWWWHYDAGTGRVVQRYPVYSVHQDGMAPMALLALSEAGGSNFTASVARGLEWIFGGNELQQEMTDIHERMIWRAIRFASKVRLLQQEARLAVQPGDDSTVPRGLEVLYESRPYHLGWLLYAFSRETTRLQQVTL